MNDPITRTDIATLTHEGVNAQNAELLLRATALLRMRVAETTPGAWSASPRRVDSTRPDVTVTVATAMFNHDAEYIALMHPLIGAGLAAWLERMRLLILCPPVEWIDRKTGLPEPIDYRILEPALALARAILGGDA